MFIDINKISLIIKESINTILDRKDTILNYIKSFGSKGKLPSFNGKIKDYIKKYFDEAYAWAEQSTYDVMYNGKAYAETELYVSTIGKWTFNKRGLIYVERSIDIKLDELNNINYTSIGECWSWKKGNGRSYCADYSLLDNNIIHVVLCGYVHPNSIDWVETIYLNLYKMKNETEIRMNDNAIVEISYVRIGGIKESLKGSYLINASANKYNKNKWD